MQIVIDRILTNYEVVNPKARKTVLLLHGWGSNASYWLPLIKTLSNQFRYYLLDLPGFGGTRELKTNSDVPDYTEFVHEFIKKLRLKDVILAGHSFGGQIASDFALKHKLKRLILIDAATVRVRTFRTKLKIILTKSLKPLTFLLPPLIKNKILLLYAPPEYVNANYYLRSVLHQILKYDLSKKIHLIKIPTDIIWGSEDRVIPYVGKLLVETIPKANLHVIYGAGHLPHLTHPQKLAATLNQILNEQ